MIDKILVYSAAGQVLGCKIVRTSQIYLAVMTTKNLQMVDGNKCDYNYQ